MGMSSEEERALSPRDEEWPEAEKAEKLARGAALKWASGVFYRPEKLEGLGQYRSRETQRNSSIQSRLKSTVQSYLEGVGAGLEQLRSAAQEVQSVCQDLGAARWALLDSADRFQGLQQMRALMAEHVQLASVVQVLPQLFSAHYNILSVCTTTYHQALTSHLQDILREDLDKQALFLLLEWALRVYHSPEMMGHPDLIPEVDVSALGPLMSPELVDQTERKYVVKVKASVLEWLQRTLEVEFKEWFREEEPERDHQGFFQSALPVIVMQMLSENIRVASLITDSLQQKVYTMALEELEAFLCRLREALVQCGKEHQKDRTVPKYYVSYLLAMLNNNLALSSSVSSLHPDAARREVPASLRAALDRTQKKTCQLLLEELLLDLQRCPVWLGQMACGPQSADQQGP
ncbi:exocyst complex component 3-like protein [Limosa lapponica baueri]|uniref:Exocyst complex component 3-like protein n=1 Tax=Limosa lapponica baueri TaxID=1758121 RepID=A0A2I0TBL8_LIMLA|nr:exocyst complex component 3-like protein [Limosa lapponica baueri]